LIEEVYDEEDDERLRDGDDEDDEDDDDDDDDDDDEDSNRIQVPIMAIPETYLLMIPEFLVRICIALNVLLMRLSQDDMIVLLTGRTDKERVLYTKSVVDSLETKFYGIMDNEDEMCLSEDAEQTQMEEDVRSIETCKGWEQTLYKLQLYSCR
jgi:hypothetical protein